MDNGLLVRMDPKQWQKVLQTNLTGAFYCMREAARLMLKNNGSRKGRIINVASVAAHRGWPGQVNYAASKAGLIGLTRAAARELGTKDIQVNTIAPGYTETELLDEVAEYEAFRENNTASGRIATPEESADVIAFLASPAAAYITGEVIQVDDGLFG